MKFLQFTIASAVALIFSGAALTQSPGAGMSPPAPAANPPRTLGALDANRDGSVSREEAAQNAGLAGQFPVLDANANGALEPAEFSRFESLGAESTTGTSAAPDRTAPSTPPPRSTVTPPPPLTGTPPPQTATPPPASAPPPG